MRKCFYYINMKFRVSWDPFLLTRVSVVFGDHGKPFLTHLGECWSKRQVTSVPSRKQKEIRSPLNPLQIQDYHKKVINLVPFDYHTNTSTSIPLLLVSTDTAPLMLQMLQTKKKCKTSNHKCTKTLYDIERTERWRNRSGWGNGNGRWAVFSPGALHRMNTDVKPLKAAKITQSSQETSRHFQRKKDILSGAAVTREEHKNRHIWVINNKAQTTEKILPLLEIK